MTPRVSATAAGSATCSLHVRWWYQSRSASTATRAISSMPAVSSHVACAPGNRVTTGVRMPSFMARRGLALLAGEEGAVGDDVLLHLGGAGADRRVALERVQARPRAAVDGVGPALGEEPRRSEQVDGELGERLGQVAPLELGERDLGPVLLALDDLGERPVVEQLRVLDVRERPGDPLADLGIAQGVRVGRLGGGDHGAQVGGHRDREPGGADTLVAERSHRDLPPLVFLAQTPVRWDAHVREPDLVEELVAGDVTDGTALDPRCVHVDDERGDALVLGAALDGAWVGPEEEEAPVGEVCGRDPDLLAVDDVLVAV